MSLDLSQLGAVDPALQEFIAIETQKQRFQVSSRLSHNHLSGTQDSSYPTPPTLLQGLVHGLTDQW